MKELTDKQKSVIGTRNACKIAHLLTDDGMIIGILYIQELQKK